MDISEITNDPRVQGSSRVGLVAMAMGWVDFDLNVPPGCPAAQPIQPNSQFAQAQLLGSGVIKIKVNQTQSTTTSKVATDTNIFISPNQIQIQIWLVLLVLADTKI